MKLDPDFLTEVIGIVQGEITPAAEAVKIAALLDSNQEFLAWLLLRRGVAAADPQLAAQLVKIANTCIVKAESRLLQSEFPLEQQQAYYQLKDALREIITADCNVAEVGERAQQSLVKYGQCMDNQKKPG